MSSLMTHLECTLRGRTYSADDLHGLCPADSGVLFARYDLERARRELDREEVAAWPLADTGADAGARPP